MPLIREVLETMQVPQLCVEGVEADDVIATLATQAAAEGLDVIVVTGDRDAFQLIEDPHIKVLYNRRGVSDYVLYDEAGIVERYLGVTARQYPQYAALRGDNSDNLPGVPGIGEKTAAALIVKYGDLDAVFEHLDELPPKQRQNLGEHKDRVLLNRTMTCLRRDLELEFAPGDLRQGAWDPEAVRTLFNQLEFRSLFARLPMAMGEAAPPGGEPTHSSASWRTSGSSRRPPASWPGAAGGETVRAGTPVLGPVGRSDLLGLAVASDDAAPPTCRPMCWKRRRWWRPSPPARARRPATRGPPGQGADPRPAAPWGPAEMGTARSTSAPSTSTPPSPPTCSTRPRPPTSCPELARRYLSLDVAAGTAAEEGQLDLDGNSGVEEAGRRAAAVHRLAVALEEGMAARELTELYQTVERPLVRVLARMEEAGVRVDLEFLRELSVELTKECGELEARIHAAAGERFQINSVPQLRRILFEKLGLTPVKKTKTGPSTDADSLQKMAADHPIVEELLRFREVEKLRNTYADTLPPLVGPDGRIHGSFNQTVATTGRISSESPNLQNIPLRTPGGREFRRAFIPAEGCELLMADYSQIELRLLAHLAQDPGLIEAFQRDADVHTTTAAQVFGVPEEEVAPFQRRFAKVVNYGLAYGMEAYGLGQRMDIPDRPGQRDPRRLLRLLPEREVVHGVDGQGGPIPGLHDDADGPAPASARAVVRQLPDSPDGGADGPERPRPGRRGRHLQAGHGQPRRRAGGAGHAIPHGADRPRRGGPRGTLRGARRRRRPGAAGDGVGGHAGSPAQGGHCHRIDVGRRQGLTPLWLSHHDPGAYDRCVVVAGRHVCRRCLVLYPLAFVVLVVAQGSGWSGPTEALALVALPLPAVLSSSSSTGVPSGTAPPAKCS